MTAADEPVMGMGVETTTPVVPWDAARAWLAQDPDPETRDELAAVIAAAEAGDAVAAADLVDRFGTRLAFGTAGLRGRLGAGSNRMNRVLVTQAAAGLAAYLLEKAGPDAPPVVVIGYDGRRGSARFAQDSAEIFAGAGLRAILLPRLLPTPVLAFAVRHLGADAGVMVTASHNPPDDNGYKVYLGGADDGSQIVPPADAEIAAHIQRVADAGDISVLPRSERYETADDAVVEAYVAATATVAPAPAGANGMRWVYTAMHGVGTETMLRILDAAGYPHPVQVAEQAEPDGRFPTVAFPNPEEPGAMDLALETARANDAEFILANDPDADRLAVAIPDAAAEGGWRRLTGNQIGLLLGWRAARRAAEGGTTPGASLACSLVSSPALQVVAERYGLDFHATLTGFKWISRAPGLVFGFEEALGYLVNPVRRRVRQLRQRTGVGARRRPRGHRAHHRRPPRGAAHADRRCRSRVVRGSRRSGDGAAARRHPPTVARGRRPHPRTPERHRAQAQAVPRRPRRLARRRGIPARRSRGRCPRAARDHRLTHAFQHARPTRRAFRAARLRECC
ncbi:MAG: phosphomannomutase [Microbacterium sp.]|nr:phosphomannomutase [Microbacterium sp.]